MISREKLIIVIARYNEDISNFAEFNNNLMIYNKGTDDISPLINTQFIKNVPNLGREAGTYCNYILDNYDNLPEYMIFTQGNPVIMLHFLTKSLHLINFVKLLMKIKHINSNILVVTPNHSILIA